MPGSGMFEACTAAGAALLHDSQGATQQSSQLQLTLQQVNIAAPMPLGDAAGPTNLLLQVSVVLATGAVRLSSLQPSNRNVESCSGTVAAAWAGNRPAVVASTSASNDDSKRALLGNMTLPLPSCGASADIALSSPAPAGYFVHPAAMDATLHLTAASKPIAPPQPTKSGGAAVPTGLACLLVCLEPGIARKAHPLAVPDADSPSDGSHLCSFRLAHSCQNPAFAISDLLVRQLAAPSTSKPAAAPVSQQAEVGEMLYEIQWQAASGRSSIPAGDKAAHKWQKMALPDAATGPLPARAAVLAEFPTSYRKVGSLGSARSALWGMELLQRGAAVLGAGGGLTLLMRGAHLPAPSCATQQDGGNSCAGLNSLAALARVAANEFPSASIKTLDLHQSVPESPLLTAHTEVAT